MRNAFPVCRLCDAELRDTFVDLGETPLCEKFVAAERLHEPETVYPLHAWVCRRCLLVQLEALVTPQQLFSEYAYFSSYSDSWVAHARDYSDAVSKRFRFRPSTRIVEIASNDGYLLQHFAAQGFSVLGVEPAANVARKAIERGIPTEIQFFGRDCATTLVARDGRADLIVANNVLAHVPHLNDFVAGLKYLLAPGGVITLEFPHLARLIEGSQFDTIYHEHFSYFSLLTVARVLQAHNLSIFDVQELTTHGGSLRVFVQHAGPPSHQVTSNVQRVLATERRQRLDQLGGYAGFQGKVERVRDALVAFLTRAKADGKRVAGYGAPGKGNTLLNYCRIGPDLLEYTVDRNPYKHGLFTPGMHIPIYPPARIAETRPDYALILPWNLKDEIVQQLADVRAWGARFVVAIPQLEIF